MGFSPVDPEIAWEREHQFIFTENVKSFIFVPNRIW